MRTDSRAARARGEGDDLQACGPCCRWGGDGHRRGERLGAVSRPRTLPWRGSRGYRRTHDVRDACGRSTTRRHRGAVLSGPIDGAALRVPGMSEIAKRRGDERSDIRPQVGLDGTAGWVSGSLLRLIASAAMYRRRILMIVFRTIVAREECVPRGSCSFGLERLLALGWRTSKGRQGL